MKVCMLSTSFPRYSGDRAGIFVHSLALALQRLGIDVEVIAPHAPGAAIKECLHGVPVRRVRYWWPSARQGLAYGTGIISNLKGRRRLVAQAPTMMASMLGVCFRNASSADLIHAHFSPMGMAALPARYLLGRPLVISLHGSDIEGVQGNKLFNEANRQVLSRTDHVIAVNSEIAAAARRLGAPPEQVSVVPNGVDVEQFQPMSRHYDTNEILCIGRLVEVKGLRYLLDAMPSILRQFPEAKLKLVGGGSLLPTLQHQAEALGIGAAVQFLGEQPHDRMQSYLAGADVFALPSLREGLPGALLEAMACGKAVVATSVGGVPEILENGKNGIMVAPAMSEALADAISQLLGDNEARERLGQAARSTVEARCAWPIIAAQVLDIYKKVLSERGNRTRR